LAALAFAAGCRPPGRAATSRDNKPGAEGKASQERFETAINTLNRLEAAHRLRVEIDAPATNQGKDAGASETVRVSQMETREDFDLSGVHEQILQAFANKDEILDPLRATCPAPEALLEVADHLSRWAERQQAPGEWSRNPLLAALPEALTDNPIMQSLDSKEFTYYDAYSLLEAVWLRDLSNYCTGANRTDGLRQARALFDWTVRHIQLEPDHRARTPQFPWEAMLLGRGTPWERAWVFILLCRQQKLDAAILALPEGDRLRDWCVAVLVDKDLYLFDPVLGLPVPGPKGVRLDEHGQLDVPPATWKQVVADPKVLGRADQDANHPYWVRRADLKKLTVLVEASPLYLSLRAKLLESHLAGKDSLVLSADPAAQADRLKTAADAAEAGLWRLPQETLRRRWYATRPEIGFRLFALMPLFAQPAAPLFRGRVMQLKGDPPGDVRAVECFLACRPPDKQLQEAAIPAEEKAIHAFAKVNASYWLGLKSFEERHFDSAIDYFSKRTIEAIPPPPWTSPLEQNLGRAYDVLRAGAHYNLGRTYEALGKPDLAVAEYEGTGSGQQGYLREGQTLRARWLREVTAGKANKPAPGKK
jgi:tetratricopeptide (TPR) repeat protein